MIILILTHVDINVLSTHGLMTDSKCTVQSSGAGNYDGDQTF